MTSTEQPPMRLLRVLRDPDEPGKVLVEITPPQSAGAKPTKGCYCFVVDCSGSMQSPADVKSDDGDKVSLGYSQLDISKHATSRLHAKVARRDSAPAGRGGLAIGRRRGRRGRPRPQTTDGDNRHRLPRLGPERPRLALPALAG